MMYPVLRMEIEPDFSMYVGLRAATRARLVSRRFSESRQRETQQS
jgi:hypothetical protein